MPAPPLLEVEVGELEEEADEEELEVWVPVAVAELEVPVPVPLPEDDEEELGLELELELELVEEDLLEEELVQLEDASWAIVVAPCPRFRISVGSMLPGRLSTAMVRELAAAWACAQRPAAAAAEIAFRSLASVED